MAKSTNRAAADAYKSDPVTECVMAPTPADIKSDTNDRRLYTRTIAKK